MLTDRTKSVDPSEFSLASYRNYHGKLAAALKGIAGNKNIKKLTLRNCSLTSDDIEDLMAVAKTLPELIEIDLSHNSLGDVNNSVLMRFAEVPTLKMLRLRGNNIYVGEATLVVEKLAEAKRETTLELDLNSELIALDSMQQLKLKFLNSKIVLSLPKFDSEREKLEEKGEDFSGVKIERLFSRLNDRPLRIIKLANCKLGDEEIKILCRKLSASQLFYLEHLDFSGNHFGPVGCAAIAELMAQCRQLKEVGLANNKLETKGIDVLAQGIRASQSLTKLDLAGNQLDLESFAIVRKAMAAHPTLTERGVDLSRNVAAPGEFVLENRNLKDEWMTAIRPLSLMPVRKLCLSHCAIGDAEIKAVIEVLEKNQLPYLEELHLPGNQITDQGFELLSQFAQKCPHLRVMNLAHNQITLNGAGVLSKLNCMAHLQELDLSHNQIEDRGASAIAVKISCTHAMRKLNLRGNKISDGEIIKLILSAGDKEIGLAGNLPITKLNWVNSGLRDGCVKQIARIVAEEKLGGDLEEIDFSRNQLTDAGVDILADMAKLCPKLRKVNIEKNQTKKAVEWVRMPRSKVETGQSDAEVKKGSAVSQAPAMFAMKPARDKRTLQVFDDYFSAQSEQNPKVPSVALGRNGSDKS